MVKNGEYFMIKEMKQRGMNITQIAETLGRDRKTIRKWLNQGPPEGYQRTIVKPGKLDPFKDYIRQRMEEGCYNGVVLFDEIKEQGYQGSLSTLRNFMRPLRPVIQSKVTERFETPPGRQAQVDWGQFIVDWNGKKKRLYAFVMVLGYSRMMYVEFTEDEKLETLMGCHLRAMQYFGGTTETCLYDNMKTVVTGVDQYGDVIWNNRFAAFADHHGFILQRCQPYRARTKGKVENGVKYVRHNFWPRVRTFTDLHDLNLQARRWMDTVANVRIHGTTHEVPVERWRHEGLKKMNLIPFEQVERHARKVTFDACISYEANRYSVPFQFAGNTVYVQDDRNGRIRIYYGEQLIAEHTKAAGKHHMIKHKKHFEGIRATGQRSVPQPTPRLVAHSTPVVAERDVSFYEQFAEGELQ